tara:strand:- start:17071 stop:17382 length:312 start_codon:yes stop_codon:yes gene_type:complete
VSLLPDARRKAITTVVVTERDAANLARRLLAFRIELRTRPRLYKLSLIKNQLSYLSRMLSVMALPGLERVVIEDWSGKFEKEYILAGLRHCMGSRHVEVVFGD